MQKFAKYKKCSILHILTQKTLTLVHVKMCKYTKLFCKWTVTVHICMVTVHVQMIFLFFFSLSLICLLLTGPLTLISLSLFSIFFSLRINPLSSLFLSSHKLPLSWPDPQISGFMHHELRSELGWRHRSELGWMGIWFRCTWGLTQLPWPDNGRRRSCWIVITIPHSLWPLPLMIFLCF